MSKRSCFSGFVSLLLAFGLVAAVAFAQTESPCATIRGIGSNDTLIFTHNGVLYSVCASEDPTSGNLVVSDPSIIASLSGITQNVIASPNAFYAVTNSDIALFVYGSDGFVESGSWLFPSFGGFPFNASLSGLSFRFPMSGRSYQLNQSGSEEITQTRVVDPRTGCSQAIKIGDGFEFCNKGGLLFEPTVAITGVDYSQGRTYFPITDIVVRNNTAYVLTPNTGRDHTGQLLSFTVDSQGNIVNQMVMWTNVDVPVDGISRLAAGSHGIYFQTDRSNIILVAGNTNSPAAAVFLGTASDVYGSFAVLGAPSQF